MILPKNEKKKYQCKHVKFNDAKLNHTLKSNGQIKEYNANSNHDQTTSNFLYPYLNHIN